MLRASTACTFSTSQLPKVLRTWDALYTLTSKCAPRRNCVQFFISHLTRWVRTRRFSEPTYHWKNIVNRDFSTFSRTCIFFLLTLSLPWSSLFCPSLLWFFPPLLFHLSIWSEVWLLNFLRSCKSLQDPGCPGWHWAMQGKSWGQGKAHKPDHSQPPRRPDFFWGNIVQYRSGNGRARVLSCERTDHREEADLTRYEIESHLYGCANMLPSHLA